VLSKFKKVIKNGPYHSKADRNVEQNMFIGNKILSRLREYFLSFCVKHCAFFANAPVHQSNKMFVKVHEAQACK